MNATCIECGHQWTVEGAPETIACPGCKKELHLQTNYSRNVWRRF
jgi:ribosomal protein S27E